jgi:predicted nuclease of predicted toxin-antitoxin system
VKLRFQVDADLDARLIRDLKRVAPRIDIRAAAASGSRRSSDSAVLQKSAVDNRVPVSQDRKVIGGFARKYLSLQVKWTPRTRFEMALKRKYFE